MKNIIIDNNITIQQAMKKLSKARLKCLVVLDAKKFTNHFSSRLKKELYDL